MAILVTALVAGGLAVAVSSPLPAGAQVTPVPPVAYQLGDLDGQNGWGGQAGGNINDTLDQEVVSPSGAPASFAEQSWRFSNAVSLGSFGDQPFSPSLTDEAGEAVAESGGLSGGARQDRFEAEWEFSSASPTAAQPGVGITVSPDRGDGARMSWVRMEDHPDGLRVLFNDYQSALSPGCGGGGFVQTTVATGLDRATAHHVRLVMDFVDGPANDVVTVEVDGNPAHTGTSWEDYFRDCESNETRTVDSLLFRVAGAAAPASDGAGLLIDNVALRSADATTDATASEFATGFEGVTSTTTTVVVDEDETEWWRADTRQRGQFAFRETFGGRVGDGALVLRTTGNNPDKVQLMTNRFSGTRLEELDGLRYSTYRSSASTGFVAGVPAINIRLDRDGDDQVDAYLVFEPYQDQGNAAVLSDTWQTWDAIRGGDALWWSPHLPGCPQATPCTWDTILSTWPDAQILDDPDSPADAGSAPPGDLNGSIGPNLGSFNANLITAVDAFTVTVGGVREVIDFEMVEDTTTTEVTEADETEWFVADTRNGGTLDFTDDLGGQLGGSAAVLATTANADKVQLLTDLYDDTLLAEIDQLTYSTRRDAASAGFIAGLPALNLRVDRDGDDVVDAYLVYEPYQDLGNGAVDPGAWQTWDAIRGGSALWWSGQLPGCGQATPCSWTDIIAQWPQARVLEDPDGLVSPSAPTPTLNGSLGVNLGSFNPDLRGAVDALTVSVDGQQRVFDFKALFPPDAPTGLTATSTAPGVELTWSAPANTGDGPVTGYTIYRDGDEVGTTDGSTTTFVDDAPAGSVAYAYTVTATNVIGESVASNTATVTHHLFWEGLEWTVLNGTAVVNGDDEVELTRLSPGQSWIQVVGAPPVNANGTPWVQFSYEDDGNSWQGFDMFIDSELPDPNPRISVGSLFANEVMGYARYGNPAAVEEIVFPVPETPVADGPRPAEEHTIYVGQKADGRLDYEADGEWYTTDFLLGHGAPFSFENVLIRWRCNPTGAVGWERVCVGGETATITDFAYGDDHDDDAPGVTIATPANGATVDRGAVVAADFACTDEPGGSGLVSCEGTLDGDPIADGDPIDTATLGAHELEVTGTDTVGNATTVTHTYTVVDVTDPAVTITTPADGAVHDVGELVEADYACTDAALELCFGSVPDGAPIDTVTPGVKEFTVFAFDASGNLTVVTHSYRVVDDDVVVVSSLGGEWFAADTRGAGSVVFSDELDGELGAGSAVLSTTAGPDKVQLLTDRFDGTLLREIAELSYATHRDPASTGFVAGVPSINLRIDRDGDDVVDSYLIFEPYQDQGNAAVLSGEWQVWDAIRGGDARWWASHLPGCGQATPCTWDHILTTWPDARVLEDPDAPVNSGSAPPGPLNGSLGVNMGSGNPGLRGGVDALTVTVGAERTIFDFERRAVPSAPTGLVADPGDGVVDLSWTAPADDGDSPVSGYVVYRDGLEVGTTDGATTFQDTTANGAVASSVAYSYTVAAVNAVGEGPESNSAAATVNLFWNGFEWVVKNGSAEINGDGGVDLTRLAGGETWIRMVGDPDIDADSTPWAEFSYEDDGNSRQGIDMFIDSNVPDPNPRISVGSLFANEVMGYARYGNPTVVEEIVFPTPETPEVNGPRPGGDHTIYVGQRADGVLDYEADGTWYATDHLVGHGGPFDWKDVILRWRCNPSGAVGWERQCTGGETITFNDFAVGDDHGFEDVTAPTVTITTPADGAVHDVGEVVEADYDCADEALGSGLVLCFGSVPDGVPIDTATAGERSFTVFAIDAAGNLSSTTHDYRVVDDDVVVVSSLGGEWFAADTRAAGDLSFSEALGGEVGAGSAVLSTTAGPDKVQLLTDRFDGTLLREIAELSYATHRDPASTGFVAGVPSINLRIDRDGDDVVDSYLVFEPYQDQGNAAVLSGEWQVWDAIRGGDARWWASHLPGCGQATPCTWDHIVSTWPDARVLEDPDAPVNSGSAPPGPLNGSLGVNMGSGNPGLVGGADALTVTVGDTRTIFDFERREVPGAPIALAAVPGDGVVDLTWTAPVDDGGSPITGYVVYRDGLEVGTTDGATTFQDTTANGAVASSVAYAYTVTAVNESGESPESNTATATVNLFWRGLEWDLRNATAVVNGDDEVEMTRLAGGESWIHLVPDPAIDADSTPWAEFSYEDDGNSWQGVDMFIDSEVPVPNPRISVGSMFANEVMGYARYGPGGSGAIEQIVFPVPETPAVDGPRPGGEHTIYVGQRADGVLDYEADGTWHSTDWLVGNGGPFDWKDVLLRWRCSATGAVGWERQCVGGETLTFTDFAMGDDHDDDGPQITVDVPLDGAELVRGSSVAADYACTDPAGVVRCDGDVADGDDVDTSTLGVRDFTVEAEDEIGNTSTLTVSYTVVDGTDPSVSITSPEDGEVYAQGSTVLADYACTDDVGGSGIASCVGTVADGTAVDTSTPGAHTFTVTATDVAGNQTVVEHRYRVRDTAGPSVSVVSPVDGQQVARGAVVLADFACADEPGGSGLDSCVGSVPDGDPIDTATLGPKEFTVTGTDVAGNETVVSRTYTVVDAADPSVTISSPADGAVFQRGQVVLADYACSDEAGGSGLVLCFGTVPDGLAVDTATLGPKAFTVFGLDGAGNVTSLTHSYTVVDGTDPTVSISSPADGATFARGESVLADFSCADEQGGSGIASCVGTVADGAAVETGTLGPKSFSVTATDVAGNETVVTHSYTVVDDTAPLAVLSTPPDGAQYQVDQVVVADFACADEPAGSGIDTCVGTVADGAQVDTSTAGEHEFTVTATDEAGNETVVTHTYEVLDGSELAIAVTTPANGASYARNAVVNADFACSDAPGGAELASCVGTVADGAAVDTATLGAKTFTVTATDTLGNEKTVTVNYTVVDATKPSITITTPADGATHDRGATVLADFSCADEAGGSGVALCFGTVPDGIAIDTATLGTRAFTVFALDEAGNLRSTTHTYTVGDGTDPTVDLDSPMDGATFEQGEAVLADFSCADETGGSGLASCVGTVVDGAAVDTSTLGEHDFTVTATDVAGNETVVTHTYTVGDVTAPTVTITTPPDGSTYLVGEAVTAEFVCEDEPSGSGIDTCVGTVADGAAVDTTTPGELEFTVTATDVAGNETVVTHAYTVEAECASHPFPDVPTWVEDAVVWAHCNTYMTGINGLFEPNQDITRAQVARFLYRVSGSPDVSSLPAHGFSDVPNWVEGPVRWLAANDFATGYDDGTFRPNLTITRAEVSRMLFRIAGSPSGSPANGFSDVPPWVDDAVSWLTDPANDPPFATGYDDGTYRPSVSITRAQTVRMACRIENPPGTC